MNENKINEKIAEDIVINNKDIADISEENSKKTHITKK